jgi:cytidyltransferase-like protein
MRGLAVVIYGCFDLFHDGHKYLLDVALKNSFEGMIYILLFSDELVKSLKGDNRPFDNLTTRSSNIERHVSDWNKKNCESPRIKIIIINSKDMLNERMDFFKPNMVVQGDDWIKDYASKWPVLIVPCLKDRDNIAFSTSKKISDRSR